MKKINLLIVISFGIFALTGCGANTAEKANTATTEKTNTGATQNQAAPKKVLKPSEISPDKALTVNELIDSVTADSFAWLDKEVTVTGNVSSTSSSGPKGYLMTLTSDPGATNKYYVNCHVPSGDMPDSGIISKTVEVKGKIKEATESERKLVRLEPCELKK